MGYATMLYNKLAIVWLAFAPFFQFTLAWNSQHKLSCKASPDSPDWPSPREWAALNQSISGRLLQPPPPGAVCHPGQPTYNAAACPALDVAWFDLGIHVADPISSLWNNWNNDSCIPYVVPSPCSGKGYPVYVINATSKEHVKAGVDFARTHNVRLNIKGTGHDYLGR